MAISVFDHLDYNFQEVRQLDKDKMYIALNKEIQGFMHNPVKGQYFLVHGLLSTAKKEKISEIESSNIRMFMIQFPSHPDVLHIKTPNEEEYIAIDLTCTDARILKTLQYLEEHITLSDEDAENMKMEMINKAWYVWIKDAFIDKIRKKFNVTTEPEDDPIFQLYCQLQKEANEYPTTAVTTVPGRKVDINLDKLIAKLCELPDCMKKENAKKHIKKIIPGPPEVKQSSESKVTPSKKPDPKKFKLTLKQLTNVGEIDVVYTKKVNVRNEDRPKIGNSLDCYQVFHHYWPEGKINLREEIKVLLLNNTNHVMEIMTVTTGGISIAIFDLHIFLAAVINKKATGIVIAHNHTSGNLDPSLEDKKVSRKIKRVTALHDIRLLDHLIISDEGYFSFIDEGLL